MPKLVHNSLIAQGVIQDVSIFHIKTSSFCRSAIDDDIVDLSNSIKQKGLLQPIVVRVKGQYFEIVSGNRRYNACKYLAWRKIPCYVVELDDKNAFEVSLVENIQRKTLNPIDETCAFKKYMSDFGWGGITDLSQDRKKC